MMDTSPPERRGYRSRLSSTNRGSGGYIPTRKERV